MFRRSPKALITIVASYLRLNSAKGESPERLLPGSAAKAALQCAARKPGKLEDRAGEIVRREVILSRVWGYGDQIRTRTLDVHIRRLLTKLGAYSPQYLETIFGIGYRFQPYQSDRRFQPSAAAPALTMIA